MNEQLYKYFLGELSDTDKKELLNRIESNPEDKAEFIRIQNTITISKLGEQNGDNEWASRKKKELETRINRKQVRKLYINLAKYAAVVAILLVNLVTHRQIHSAGESPALHKNRSAQRSTHLHDTSRRNRSLVKSPIRHQDPE